MRVSEILREDDAGVQVEDDLFEMANLRQNRTGIPGTIHISTHQASHAPRIKYFTGRPDDGVPSFSVSVSADPQVVENSLPEPILNRMAPQVMAWVRLNHERLADFWYHGTSWFEDEVEAFKKSLVKLPRRRAKG